MPRLNFLLTLDPDSFYGYPCCYNCNNCTGEHQENDACTKHKKDIYYSDGCADYFADDTFHEPMVHSVKDGATLRDDMSVIMFLFCEHLRIARRY